MMKSTAHFLLSILMVVTMSGNLWAQTYSEFLDQRVEWKERKLTLDDFQAPIPYDATDTIVFYQSFVSTPEVRTIKVGTTTYKYYVTISRMYPSESWIRPANRNEKSLRMAQLKFDLWELYAQKAINEFSTSKVILEWDGLSSYYNSQFNHRVDDLKKVSNNGEDLDALNRYTEQIAQELSDIAFDPVAAAEAETYPYGAFLSLGLQSNIPRSDYVSPSVGIDMMAGVFVKSFFYGLTIDISGAKCRKDIKTSKGMIYDDDEMLAGAMNLMFGKNAFQKKGFNVTPYLGAGVKFYDGGEKDYYERETDRTTEKAGFSIGMGALLDIPVRHTVCLKTDFYRGYSTRDHSIQIKPFVSCTKFHGDMGWMPSINIAVSYSWGTLNNFKPY